MTELYRETWIYPPAGDIVRNTTPPQASINYRFRLLRGNNATPITVFLQALYYARNAVTTRWLNSHMVINWEHARVQVVMRSTLDRNFTTRFFPLVTAEADFTTMIDFLYASFNIEDFRHLPYVDFEITLQFTAAVAEQNQPRRLRSAGPQVHHRYNPPRQVRSQTRIANIQQNLGGRGLQQYGPRAGNRGYMEMKRKLFHRSGLDDFYNKTDAVLHVPSFRQGICFPMAFMKCQLRILDKNEVSKLRLLFSLVRTSLVVRL